MDVYQFMDWSLTMLFMGLLAGGFVSAIKNW